MYFMSYYNSMVETILDKEEFTLEELLDEEEIIQECKDLNSRLVNFLRDRTQVEQLLHYVIEEPPEDADSKRAFKFPFIACEIFSCEIDVILKTLVEEEELMKLLFSFLETNRPHNTVLAGYFSKVVICLMLHKTIPLMNYVQAHQDVFRQLIDLIGITSIMEVLIRLVGADDHVYPNFLDAMQWLADSNLLEMIVDKLSPSSTPEVHANAAETLCVISRNSPSSLATKLSSPSFVARIFSHALEDSHSKSGLVHSLSVCISLMDPKRWATMSPLMNSFHSQQIYEPSVPVNPETITAMLPRLGDLLVLLNVASNENILPTTYGQLKPPLGKHRLKIVEFVGVLLRVGNEATERELVGSGAIKRILDLFFEYPYNNALHHHVESIIVSCLETKREAVIDHLLRECNLIGKFLQTDKHPVISGNLNQPTLPASGKKAPLLGNIGHITRVSNKLIQLGNSSSHIQSYLQENSEWNEWQSSVLRERNVVENVYRWACGRPTAPQDRTRYSDEDDIHDRDYDVAALANNLSQAFRYYPNDEAKEDVYFDDESAEVVISSLRLGEDKGSLFTNSNWFAFQDDRIADAPASTSTAEIMDGINLDRTGIDGGDGDGVMVRGEDELNETKDSINDTSFSNLDFLDASVGDIILWSEMANSRQDINFSGFEATNGEDLFGGRPLLEWAARGESPDMQVCGSSLNPFIYNDEVEAADPASTSIGDPILVNGSSPSKDSSDASSSSDASHKSTTVSSLFEEDAEFVAVELEGTEKAMEHHGLKEGTVSEACPLKRSIIPNSPEKEISDDGGTGTKEFNDANYWRVDHEVVVSE